MKVRNSVVGGERDGRLVCPP